jgi:GMP synthase (glutamine-hydrolysing)
MSVEWRPRALIVQHEEATPPGLMTAWLAEQGAQVDTLRIDEDERLVEPRNYDVIVSLGSEFAAFDDKIPWVPREAILFEDALEHDVPILGLCFGGQMLARALGGKGYRSDKSEIGWLPVRTNDPDLVSEGPWFQWHFDSFTAPPGADVIAQTDIGPQAFVAGRSLGLQFHPEVTPGIVDGWLSTGRDEVPDPEPLRRETARRAEGARERAFALFDRVAAGWAPR